MTHIFAVCFHLRTKENGRYKRVRQLEVNVKYTDGTSNLKIQERAWVVAKAWAIELGYTDPNALERVESQRMSDKVETDTREA